MFQKHAECLHVHGVWKVTPLELLSSSRFHSHRPPSSSSSSSSAPTSPPLLFSACFPHPSRLCLTSNHQKYLKAERLGMPGFEWRLRALVLLHMNWAIFFVIFSLTYVCAQVCTPSAVTWGHSLRAAVIWTRNEYTKSAAALPSAGKFRPHHIPTKVLFFPEVPPGVALSP